MLAHFLHGLFLLGGRHRAVAVAVGLFEMLQRLCREFGERDGFVVIAVEPREEINAAGAFGETFHHLVGFFLAALFDHPIVMFLHLRLGLFRHRYFLRQFGKDDLAILVGVILVKMRLQRCRHLGFRHGTVAVGVGLSEVIEAAAHAPHAVIAGAGARSCKQDGRNGRCEGCFGCHDFVSFNVCPRRTFGLSCPSSTKPPCAALRCPERKLM